jgi:phospholysine phosphohistidine inorganic pyrophosphate phosphatase
VTSELPRLAALLVDLDGVLYVEDEPVEGAADAIGKLREAGLVLRFVTNTTARSHAQTLDKLERLGFDVEADELVTPAGVFR